MRLVLAGLRTHGAGSAWAKRVGADGDRWELSFPAWSSAPGLPQHLAAPSQSSALDMKTLPTMRVSSEVAVGGKTPIHPLSEHRCSVFPLTLHPRQHPTDWGQHHPVRDWSSCTTHRAFPTHF